MQLRLASVKNETDDVKTFTFVPDQPLHWRAGQYLHYKLPHPDMDDRGDTRWFTISFAPFNQNPTITTRFAGEHGSSFKRTLANLQVGDTIEADGPEGDFVIDDPSQQYVFIAGGIGITPMHAILTQLHHDDQPINVVMLYANRDEHSYVFDAELSDIAAAHPEFTIHKFTDPNHIEADDIRSLVDDLQAPWFYVSGPEPMVAHYKEVLLGLGVPEAHIKLDDFPGYPA